MVAVALEVAPTAHMACMNIQILMINVLIVDHHLSGVVHTARVASINMNQGKANAAIVDLVHTEVVRIVHLENMNIKKMGKFASQLNSNHN